MMQQVTADLPVAGQDRAATPDDVADESPELPGVCRLTTAATMADVLRVPPAAIRHWIRSGLLQVAKRSGGIEWLAFGQLVVGRHLAQLLTTGL